MTVKIPESQAAADPAKIVGVPAVSVVMTVYNTACYLEAAVQSILNQTFADFEFIIIDDGSTDSSPSLLRRFADADPRIKLHLAEHRGIVISANEGLHLARGRDIARMDSDDISHPDRLRQQVEYLDAHPECILLGCDVSMIDPYGSPYLRIHRKQNHDEIEAEMLTYTGGMAVVQPAAMIRAAALHDMGDYRGDADYAEDLDLFLRLAEVGRVANLPDVLFYYRRHPTSVSQVHFQKQTIIRNIIQQAYARRGKPFPADWKTEPWTPMSPADQRILWGWAALKAGNVPVARKHAAHLLLLRPFAISSWRLLYCALRGR